MPERRYDEDETRRIFDRASQVPALPSEGSAEGGTAGFTLAELQDIGAEAGLDPARIAQAARSLEASSAPGAAAPATWRLAGLPMGVSRDVVIPGAFTEDDWNRLVVDLRRTFNAGGHLRTDGDFREWRNGNLRAMVEPSEHGHRLRLSTVKGSAQRMLGVGALAVAMAAVLLVVFALSGELAGGGDDWMGPLFMALMGGGALTVGAVQLPSWARTRARQMEEVAARALLRARRGADDDGERAGGPASLPPLPEDRP